MPSLTVAQNVFLGVEPRQAGFQNRRELRRRYRRAGRVGRLRARRRRQRRDRCAPPTSRRSRSSARCRRNAQLIVMDEPTAALSRPDVEALHAVIRQLASQRHDGGARLALPGRGARARRRGDDPARRPPRADRARRRADRGVADGGDARPVARRDVPGQAARRARTRRRCSRSATWSRPGSTASRSTCGPGRSSAWPAWSARAAPRSPGRSTGRTGSTPGRSASVRRGQGASTVTGTPAVRDAGRGGDDPGVAQGAGPAARPPGDGERQPVHASPRSAAAGMVQPGAERRTRARRADAGGRPRRRPGGPRRRRCPAATSRSCCSPGRCCATRGC